MKSIDELLTDEEREELYADLAKMAKQRRMAEDAAADIKMALAADEQARWRHPGEGRLDSDGARWWACDPYPHWYRWEDGVLYERGGGSGVGVYGKAVAWADEGQDV